MMIEVLLLVSAVAFYCIFVRRLGAPKNLPPGPRPLPVIGNLLNVLGTMPHMHEAFCKLSQIYGDVFTVYLQGQRMVVVNSVSAAREALLTRKDDFAGRPYVFTPDYLTRSSKDIVFSDFSERLKLLRKIATKAFRMFMPQVESKVQREVDELIGRVKSYGANAADIKHDVQLSIMNVVCALLFGQRYDITDEEFLQCVYFTDMASTVSGMMTPLSLFPWLIHFPIQSTRDINECCRVRDEILNRKYREHLNSWDERETRDLTDALIKAKLDEENMTVTTRDIIDEDDVVMTMLDVFVAGVETNTATILWTLVHLATHPEIQAKAHAQVDRVVGFDRKPELKDKPNLPYIEAVLAETARLCTVVPLSIPHKSTRDTTLQGYSIPKDTILMLNLWALHHDQREWKNPEEFRPERFLDSAGELPSRTARSFMPFGAGRRSCLGEALAKQQMFLVIAGLLQQFEFVNPPNAPLGHVKPSDGIVRAPQPFKVCMRDRTKYSLCGCQELRLEC